jgi:hypothetical protein
MGIKTISFIQTPAIIRELTICQGKNATRVLILLASLKIQLSSENLLAVKASMPQKHHHYYLHSIYIHHETTYFLLRQEHIKSIKTVSFIPAPATMRELTSCQGKNPT